MVQFCCVCRKELTEDDRSTIFDGNLYCEECYEDLPDEDDDEVEEVEETEDETDILETIAPVINTSFEPQDISEDFGISGDENFDLPRNDLCPNCNSKLRYENRRGHTDLFTGPHTIQVLCCPHCGYSQTPTNWHPVGRPFL
jgi:predicted amidophosphoribosyltransferase